MPWQGVLKQPLFRFLDAFARNLFGKRPIQAYLDSSKQVCVMPLLAAVELNDLLNLALLGLLIGFQVWMLVDAIRREAWIWAVLIFLFSPIFALIYFVMVYRAAFATVGASGGVASPEPSQERIEDLRARIQDLDKAHLHAQLGDIYADDGDLKKAEECYRAAYERDQEDPDIQARLGRCLAQQNRHSEAKPWLAAVCREKPKHEYGHTMMALAETLEAIGEPEAALRTWQTVLQSHSYDRARVRLAELQIRQGDRQRAKELLNEVIADNAELPEFAQDREREWVDRAHKRLRELQRRG